ncbi:MAG TPA: T9SS type A sorting domain-containing protein, partial [Candidatus Kapabacteria bacterium]
TGAAPIEGTITTTSGIGVSRSTDGGITWKNIGGPLESFDTRTIAAADNNIVLVLDTGGSVWRTLNSGGSPVPKQFSASPATLFQADTVFCDSLTRSLQFSRWGCLSPSVSSFSIIGGDSASFEANNLSYDSILVTLHGIKQGNQNAQLVLTLDDGSRDTVSLAGYVASAPNALSLSTSDVKTDTLGGTVSVPITISGLEKPEDVTLILHYDGSVQYLGSFSPTGMRLDIPGDSSYRRSMLSISRAISDSIIGYAKFNVFNDSNSSAHATFDSLTVLTQTSPCEYSLLTPVTSTITTLSGCAIPILSQLIHLGIKPAFTIVPNPTSGSVYLTSNVDADVTTIEIYDMLGTNEGTFVVPLSASVPSELMLPKAAGIYTIVVHSTMGDEVLRAVEER